jgi:hypothetical protein
MVPAAGPDFIVSSVASVTSIVTSLREEGLLPLATALAVGLPTSSVEPAPRTIAAGAPSASALQLGNRLAVERATPAERRSLSNPLGAFAGLASAPDATPAAAAPSTPRQAVRVVGGDDLRSVGDGPSNPSPADLPVPPFHSPGATTGAGGSFFVPLAGLLALLALAAPATFRRRFEAAKLLAPTPFVCALERPG